MVVIADVQVVFLVLVLETLDFHQGRLLWVVAMRTLWLSLVACEVGVV